MNAWTKLFAMVGKNKALRFKPLLSLSSTTWITGQNYSKSNLTKSNIYIKEYSYNVALYMSAIAKQLLHKVHKKSTKSTISTFKDEIVEVVDFSTYFLSPQCFD
jgi:hypothetical protein